jgi:hypothetical protein
MRPGGIALDIGRFARLAGGGQDAASLRLLRDLPQPLPPFGRAAGGVIAR